MNDELFENVEVFDLELRFDPFLPPPSGVMLDPGVATVYIQDNDSNYIINNIDFNIIIFCIVPQTWQMPPLALLTLRTLWVRMKEKWISRLELLKALFKEK